MAVRLRPDSRQQTDPTKQSLAVSFGQPKSESLTTAQKEEAARVLQEAHAFLFDLLRTNELSYSAIQLFLFSIFARRGWKTVNEQEQQLDFFDISRPGQIHVVSTVLMTTLNQIFRSPLTPESTKLVIGTIERAILETKKGTGRHYALHPFILRGNQAVTAEKKITFDLKATSPVIKMPGYSAILQTVLPQVITIGYRNQHPITQSKEVFFDAIDPGILIPEKPTQAVQKAIEEMISHLLEMVYATRRPVLLRKNGTELIINFFDLFALINGMSNPHNPLVTSSDKNHEFAIPKLADISFGSALLAWADQKLMREYAHINFSSGFELLERVFPMIEAQFNIHLQKFRTLLGTVCDLVTQQIISETSKPNRELIIKRDVAVNYAYWYVVVQSYFIDSVENMMNEMKMKGAMRQNNLQVRR